MLRTSFFAIVIVACAVASPSGAQTPAELLQKGIYTQNTVGDFDAAIAVFRQILGAPTSARRYAAEAHAHIVQCLAGKGDNSAAAREFNVLARDYAEFKDVVTAAAAALRSRVTTRQSIQLANSPTRILSAIRGRVTDDRGRPLRAADVRVSAAGGTAEPRTVHTDDDGRYDVTDARAGRYNVLVTHAGFLPLRYGQRRPRELGKLLDVGDGQILEGVDFMLPRMSVIAGRITDETKEPIAEAIVLALRSVYFDGRRQFVPTGTGPLVRTDDSGAYRLVGLTPGTYLVVARAGDTWSVDEGGREQMAYAPTYYPGTTDVSSAREVTVAIGQDASNIDVALAPMRTTTISGTAFDSHGRAFPMVALAVEIRGEGFGSFGAVSRANVGSDGRFSIAHVPAGHYKIEASTLTANGNTVDPPEVAIVPIEVNGADIDGASLVGSTGGSVAGKIVTESGQLPKMQAVRIWIAPRVMGQPEPLKLGTFGNRTGFADIKDDGTFALDHVFGPARMQVTLPEGWTVKAIHHKGEDVTDAVLDFASGEGWSDVQIELTPRPTSVVGKVVDGNAPTPDGTVVVFPADRDKQFEDSRYVRAVRPDQHGRYEIRGLPPGDYLIAAVDDVEQNAWWDPEFVNALRPVAQPLALGDSASVTHTLKLNHR
jgi:hypothetical protein